VIDRARRLCFADALSLAAASLCAAGVVVTGDGLVSAAQRSSAASAMSWHDRLLLGLWTFRLEHALWFTLGLIVLWVGLGLGGQLGRHTDTVARIAGGVAIGFVLLAAVVVLGSTLVALTGSVGGGSAQISFSGRERLATWLLQSATAVAMATAWALAGVRIGERFAIAGDARHEHEDADDFEQLAPIDEPPPMVEVEIEPPPPPAAVESSQPREQPVAVPPTAVVEPPPTPSMRARRLYDERLSFSPRRDDARALLDQVVSAERAGRIDEASTLADRLAAM
jgi:hypothetical protein